MELNILTLLLALGNLAAGLAIGVYLRKRLVEGNQRNIALQGRQIIENAISEAEQIKKEALLHAKEEALQIKQRSIPADEIVERCLLRLANEGAKILEEGIALRASDCDVMYLNGYGFPAWRGGPLFAAEQKGLPVVLRDVEALCAASGVGWAPAPMLVRAVHEGKTLAAAFASR